jgi:PAS domain S-box-containing protein
MAAEGAWLVTTNPALPIASPLAPRERRFAHLLDRAVGGVLLCDAAGLIVEATTATTCELLGGSREELEGRSFFDLLHPADRDQARMAVATLADAGTEMMGEPFRAARPDGTWRWLAVSGRNLLADPDHPGHRPGQGARTSASARAGAF